mmetsp:Transcript_843/g.2056  ORF Transcript_843/g.2056 Transcript_843/m.2056 type:complete len:129 (-) Transcript_843:159-545(-)
MNPLERVCDLEPACEAELGPLQALLRQPIPASMVPLTTTTNDLQPCSAGSPINVAYIAVIAVLGAALVVMTAVAWRAAAKSKKATDADGLIDLNEHAASTKQSDLEHASSADVTIAAVMSTSSQRNAE